MRLVVAMAALALSASVGLADQRLTTRFGDLQVVGTDLDDVLKLGDRTITASDGSPLDFRLFLVDVWQDDATDLALVFGSTGGNDVCSNAYRLIEVTDHGARATDQFARCAGEVIDARVREGRLELKLRATNPRDAHIAVVVEGGQVSETKVPMQEVPAPMPGGGEQVTRWIGNHPWDVLEDPAERQRFMAIMPREKLFALMDRTSVAPGVRLADGWLVGIGNMPHQGCAEMGGFAIEVASGRVEAVMFHKGEAPELFGGQLEMLHPALQELAQIGAPSCVN